MKTINALAAATMLAGLSLAAPASAAPLFAATFNTFAPGSTATQIGTGLTEGAYGSLTAWDAAGTNAVHAVDRSGSGNWAAMLYAGSQSPNSITTKDAFVANVLGQVYAVNFLSAAAAYDADAEGTTADEYLRFTVLRTDGSILYATDYKTANWTGGAINAFSAGGFNYIGDGTGNVRLSITGVSLGGASRFGGAVDNLNVAAVPEPATWAMMLAGFGMIGGAARRRGAVATRVRFV